MKKISSYSPVLTEDGVTMLEVYKFGTIPVP